MSCYRKGDLYKNKELPISLQAHRDINKRGNALVKPGKIMLLIFYNPMNRNSVIVFSVHNYNLICYNSVKCSLLLLSFLPKALYKIMLHVSGYFSCWRTILNT